jgi:hypothetical protein
VTAITNPHGTYTIRDGVSRQRQDQPPAVLAAHVTRSTYRVLLGGRDRPTHVDRDATLIVLDELVLRAPDAVEQIAGHALCLPAHLPRPHVDPQ